MPHPCCSGSVRGACQTRLALMTQLSTLRSHGKLSLAQQVKKKIKTSRPSTPHRSVCLRRTDNGRPELSISGKVHLDSLRPWPLISDLENLFSAISTHMVNIYVTRFIEIPPEMSRQAKYVLTVVQRKEMRQRTAGQPDGRTDGRTASKHTKL